LPFIDRIQHWIADPPPDQLFEITETSIAAGSPRAPSQHKHELLAERGLTASPSAPNLLKPYLYRDALPRLSPMNGAKRPATALVIPDYAVRMALLDFQEFPSGEPERAALIRFRLRKSVPFHIDEAQLSYSIQRAEPKRVDVLAVAIARPILDEYEALFVEAGYRVGVVMPSCLATLRLCDSAGTGLSLLIKAAGANVSVVLFEESRVHLVRCLDLTGSDLAETEGESESDREHREGDVIIALLQQTLAYAEDQLGRAVARVLLCGFGPEADILGRRVEKEFGVAYAGVRSKFGGASQENAGLLGLLERYAA
jgi:type IV pilus assembly protein PilM